MWYPCITVGFSDGGASSYTETYEASGKVINMHYHWDAASRAQIHWDEQGVYAPGNHWVMDNNLGNYAICTNLEDQRINTPHLKETPWDESEKAQWQSQCFVIPVSQLQFQLRLLQQLRLPRYPLQVRQRCHLRRLVRYHLQFLFQCLQNYQLLLNHLHHLV